MGNIFYLVDLITNGFKDEIIDLLSFICIFFGVYTIISKNPVISVLFLISLFTSVSVYLLFLGLSFIGISYILVYVGAISILFLFIVMLINIRISELVSNNNNYIALAITSVITLIYIFKEKIWFNVIQYFGIGSNNEPIYYSISPNWENALIEITHISALGNILYGSYSLWLIIASLILLLAMVGSIVITIKGKKL